MFHSFSKGIRIRDLCLTLCRMEIPLLCYAADRYVKTAVGRVRVFHALLNELARFFAHIDPFAFSVVDVAYIRILAGAADLCLEVFAKFKCLIDRCLSIFTHFGSCFHLSAGVSHAVYGDAAHGVEIVAVSHDRLRI